VEDDLDPTRYPGPATGRRDVDDVTAPERAPHGILHGGHGSLA
jgi:hypothetical protein